MKLTKIYLIIALFAALSCSTRGRNALKDGLNIKGGLEKPTSVYGSISATETDLDIGHTFSAFLWPNKPKMPMNILARDVSLFSREIDRMTKIYRDRNARMIREKNFWTSWRCNKDTDVSAQQTEPQDCENIILDKDKGAHEACSCIAANDPLLKQANLDNLLKRKDLGTKIVTMMENDGEPGSNWLLGGGDDLETRTGSILKIKPARDGNGVEVYVRLKHFQKQGMVYKTGSTGKAENEGPIVNAKYDVEKKILFFILVEKVDGKFTGNKFVFDMERGYVPEGSADLVRFKGDLAKIDSKGNVLAIGGAKFDAEWNPDYN